MTLFVLAYLAAHIMYLFLNVLMNAVLDPFTLWHIDTTSSLDIIKLSGYSGENGMVTR